MILSLIARMTRTNKDRIALLARHKEYDHVLQPITQLEYLAAALLRVLTRGGQSDK